MIVPENAASNALAESAPLTTSAPGGFYERLVLAALEKMDDGHLLLQLPDGTVRHLGTQGHPLSANLRILRPAFFTRVLLYGDVGFDGTRQGAV